VTVTPTPESVTGDAQSATPPRGTATGADELRRAAARWGITTDELVQTLRDVVRMHARDASLCDWCEDPIPATVLAAGGRYCTPNHRKEASRDRIARRRKFAALATLGETQGACDLCGAACHIENALCDACIDDLNESARDAMAAEQTRKDGEEDTRG